MRGKGLGGGSLNTISELNMVKSSMNFSVFFLHSWLTNFYDLKLKIHRVSYLEKL